MPDHPFQTLTDLPRHGRVLIYGCGAAAGTVLARIRAGRPDVTVPCLMDSFKAGEAFGLPVITRADLPGLAGGFDHILIASAWWRDIAAALEREGVTAWGVAAPVLWHKYVFSNEELLRARPMLDAVEAMLATDRDRELYRFLTECRRENSPLVDMDAISPRLADAAGVRATLCAHLGGQYLDFVVRDRIHTVLHAGAYDGRDCLRFLEAFPDVAMIHGFEPQGTARIKADTLSAIRESGRVRIHPLGLWSDTCSLPLTGSGGCATLTSAVSPHEAAGNVDTVSVDGFVARNNIGRVDYLCLDVEGAELPALDGARRTIEAHRPQLAVCIYHLKEDFFRLPLILRDRLDGYVYRLGHYSHGLHETVLYAIPEELVN
ncbi:FkbM family methyltransferase [Pseudodesulfovibrio pelocollis]|uniref:FkbM family methyltransferase n=1 Tax=Pseudodesulfovibrio pelocollis TaxID=3051432 RepID=UPI00255B17D3|nr:FkbM family methyltransferase [Pseudodesulfovibrio sp. SB368]